MKVLMVSLGCDKNLVDSEVMLGLLHKAGHEITNDEHEAEAVVINTCAFIKDAQEESINTIIEYGELKKTGSLKKLIVTGCLSQRYKDDILAELPEIDTIVGAANYDAIVDAIGSEEEHSFVTDINYMPEAVGGRIVTTGASMAYLKIAEGCGKMCTYCAIPYIRGKYRSIPMEQLLASAKELAAQGVKELILVAQETTLYGVDLYGEKTLPKLLHELCKIEEIQWIRLMYCYPEEITDELIDTIAEEEKVCHYLDIPIQHSEDPVLRRMGRRTCKKDIVELIAKLRMRIPDIAIRTTLIAGFPGETEADHEALMEFVNESEFDRLGVFTYSPEEGTPAASFPNQIENEVAEKWRDDIMALQQEVSYDKNQELLGKSLTVLIEGNIYQILEFQHVKPGKGAAFVRTKLKNIISGGVVEKTFRPTEKFDTAHIDRKDMQYLYSDGELYHFMDVETFDQIAVDGDTVGDSLKFVKENEMVKVCSHEGNVFSVEPPISVELEVTETEPGVKGDTATGATKPAIVETGASVLVPLFVNQGDKIKIDTRTGEYSSRA